MTTLRKAVDEYLKMRRSLGFQLREAGVGLLDFVTFMQQHRASFITQQLALKWAQQPSTVQPAEWARRLSLVPGVRGFSGLMYLRAQYPSVPVVVVSANDDPAVIRRCMEFGASGFIPKTLGVEAMRAAIARVLEGGVWTPPDVDLKAAVLTIRGAKFGKSRLVPLHGSSRDILADYITRRERFFGGRPISAYLFVSSRGNRLDIGDIHRTFYLLSRQIGLRGLMASRGPRLHDMRHRFAVNTMLQWYRSGEDVERRLPMLSAYLGHVHVADTFWYLSAWPELMREAMKRLERRWENPS